MYTEMMQKYVMLEKEVGETPLVALTAWKDAHPAYAGVPASYAGRLDPMASGKLLILLGDECKKQKDYTKLDKVYEIEVLLDVGSDTGDALGLVEYAGVLSAPQRRQIARVLKREVGTHERPYPIFSSKTVGGKPLFLHALEGTLTVAHVPTHEEVIYRIGIQGIRTWSEKELSAHITRYLTKVPVSTDPAKALGADFRIDAVRASWGKLFSKAGERRFTILTLRVTCGSGTYMRSFATRLGEALGTKAIALSIHRSAVGRYHPLLRHVWPL